MRGTTHATIGANVVWLPYLLGMSIAPWLIFIGAFAALLPDLDASESKIKNLKMGFYIGRSKVWFKPFWPIAFIFSKIFRHRGAMHSLVAVILISIGLMVIIPQDFSVLTFVIILGYASHILTDALTKSGIEFLWPIKKNFGILPKALRVKTGGVIDTILLFVGSTSLIIFLYLII